MAANDLLLTLNAGSSSLKFSLYKAQPELSMLAHGQVEGLGDSPRLQAELGAGTRLQQPLRHDAAVGDHELALQAILDVLTHHFHGEVVSAVSHRVVHGGPEFAAPQLIDSALLAQLERHPEGLAMRELSQRLMVTGGNITGITDQLESEGLVVREAHPSDRRSFTVKLTPQGRRQFKRMAATHEQWVVELLGGWSAEQKTELYGLMAVLKNHLGALDAAAAASAVATPSPVSKEKKK